MSHIQRAAWVSSTLVLALALGCAAQYEDTAGGAQPNSEAALERTQVTEAGAAEPTAAKSPERSLADIERELATNEAKLRALGVELPARAATLADPADVGGEKFAPAPEPKPELAPDRPAGGAGMAPNTSPRPVAPSREEAEPGGADKQQGRRDKPKKGKDTKPTTNNDDFAPAPEEAKSAPLSPTEQPQLDAATRCAQVCSLSDISCELGVQICELAQRHADNEDYEQACVRATEDCDAAQEACDACST